jgi:hypothetical protein
MMSQRKGQQFAPLAFLQSRRQVDVARLLDLPRPVDILRGFHAAIMGRLRSGLPLETEAPILRG